MQGSGAILRNPTWSANANTQKRMISKQILDNICLLPFYFNIQENANTTLTASKHNTSTGLLQETCSFYWHNTLMHKCPKKCQSHAIFGRSSALNDILCFQRKFKCGPYSNSTIKLPIRSSELIKKHAHKCPIPGAAHVHEKMLQPQIIS